jgi:hypothetical protein
VLSFPNPTISVSHGAGAVRENDRRRGRATRTGDADGRGEARRQANLDGGRQQKQAPSPLLPHLDWDIITREGARASGAVESYKPRDVDDEAFLTTTTMVDRVVEDNNNIDHHGRRPQVSIDLQIGNHLRAAHPSVIHADQVVLVPSLFGSDLSVTTFHELRDELVPLLREKYRRRSDQNNKSKRKGGYCNRSNNSNKEEDEEEDEGTASGWLLDLARTEGGGVLVAPRTLGVAALAAIIAAASAGGGPKKRAAPSTARTARLPTTTGTEHSESADAAADAIDAVLNTDDDDNDDNEDEEAGELRADRTTSENVHAANPRPMIRSSSTRSRRFSGRAVAEVVRRLCRYYSIDPTTALVNVGIFVGRPRTNHVKARPAQSYVPRPPLLSLGSGALASLFSSYLTLSTLTFPACTLPPQPSDTRPKFYNSCFVVAAFGASRTIVLEHPGTDASVKVPLANNSAVAMLRDVTAHGWLYKIVEGDRSRSGGSGSGSPLEETITVLISGRCSAVRHVPATSAPVVLRHWAPRHPHHQHHQRPHANAGAYLDGEGLRRRVSVGPEGVGDGSGAEPPLAVVSEDLSSFPSRGSPEEGDCSYYGRGPQHRRQLPSRSPEADRYGGGLDPGHHRHGDNIYAPPQRSHEAGPASNQYYESHREQPRPSEPSSGRRPSLHDEGIARSRQERNRRNHHRSRSRSRSPSHPHRSSQLHLPPKDWSL